MARVTIEDCIKEIDNSFDICTLASKRAKDLASGAASSIDSKNKPSNGKTVPTQNHIIIDASKIALFGLNPIKHAVNATM